MRLLLKHLNMTIAASKKARIHMRFMMTVVIIFCLSGCAGVPKNNFRNVKVGMTPKEVSNALGSKPYKVAGRCEYMENGQRKYSWINNPYIDKKVLNSKKCVVWSYYRVRFGGSTKITFKGGRVPASVF